MSWKSDLKDWMDKYDAKNPANIELTRQVDKLNIYIKQLEEEIKQLDEEISMIFFEKLFGKWEEIVRLAKKLMVG